MVDRIKVRKAIAAFHKNSERITLSKLASTTGHSYANLYASPEFRRFAKKRVRVPKATTTNEPSVANSMAVEAPVAEPQVAVEPTPVSAEPQVKQPPVDVQETPPTCTLNIQVGEWLTLRLKTPVPEGMRKLVNSSLETAQAFTDIDAGALPEKEQHQESSDDKSQECYLKFMEETGSWKRTPIPNLDI